MHEPGVDALGFSTAQAKSLPSSHKRTCQGLLYDLPHLLKRRHRHCFSVAISDSGRDLGKPDYLFVLGLSVPRTEAAAEAWPVAAGSGIRLWTNRPRSTFSL